MLERLTDRAPSRSVWIGVVLVTINVVVFGGLGHHEFVNWDDPKYVTRNPYIASGLTWSAVKWAFTSGYAANWHPLTWVSHMLDIELYGMHAGAHHLTSLLLHVANTLVLFAVLHRMTRAVARSAVVSALFAVHPLHVESVAWIAERKDVLSTLFLFLTLAMYVRYVRGRRPAAYAATLVLYALGLLAKPMLVTMPFVLLLLDYWPLARMAPVGPAASRTTAPPRPRESLATLVVEKLPLFALALASSIVTFLVQRRSGAVADLDALPLGLRMQNAVVSYVMYLGKMLWPAHLTVVYPHSTASPALTTAAVVALVAFTAVAVWTRRRTPYVLVGWLWYVGTLVPVIGLVQVGNQSIADRYTYVPLVGLFCIGAWGVPDLTARWPFRRVALTTLAGLVIAACGVAAWRQVQYWTDSVALWQHALQVTAGNAIAENNLAIALAQQGRLDEAIPHFSASLRLDPANADAHNNMGVALATQGRVEEAIQQYEAALHLQPEHVNAHTNLGVAFLRQQRVDAAIREFDEALRLRPGFDDARNGLARARAARDALKERPADTERDNALHKTGTWPKR